MILDSAFKSSAWMASVAIPWFDVLTVPLLVDILKTSPGFAVAGLSFF